MEFLHTLGCLVYEVIKHDLDCFKGAFFLILAPRLMLAMHDSTTKTILKLQFFLRWIKIIAVSMEFLHTPVIS